MDPVLQPYLESPDEDYAEGLLRGELYARHIEPVGRAVVQRRFAFERTGGGGEAVADEVFGAMVARMLPRLRRLRSLYRSRGDAAGPTPCIRDLDAYIATAADRACDDLLRRRYPARTRLKNRVRYLLAHTNGLGAWPGPDGELLCGFSAWHSAGMVPTSAPIDIRRLLWDEPDTFLSTALSPTADRLPPGALCAVVFDAIGAPVPLDDLVGLLAVTWQVNEERRQTTLGDAAASSDGIANPLLAATSETIADVATLAERREYLTHLWIEVQQLPARQAAALLLNLRDDVGRGVIALLPLLGVATVSDIATVVELPAAEFTTLWDRLPLDDTAIASQLQATRQQVINLRKSGRERLARRMLHRIGDT